MITENEKAFFTFIYNRQVIWYKRFILKENPPWTDDPILHTFKIINMYRELDACTRYIIQKLKGIQKKEKLLLNVIFYRFFNKNNFYELLDIEPFEKIEKVLFERCEQLRKDGIPLFNNAYLISAQKKNEPKYRQILNILSEIDLKKVIENIDKANSPNKAFEVLQTIPLVGPFLACEIWLDLSYLHVFTQYWTDDDLIYIGPGAKWGLEILYEKKMSQKELKEKLIHLYHIQESILPSIQGGFKWKGIAYKDAASHYPFLSKTNIEGALCEWRKYMNLKKGKGKRRYYHQKNNPKN